MPSSRVAEGMMTLSEISAISGSSGKSAASKQGIFEAPLVQTMSITELPSPTLKESGWSGNSLRESVRSLAGTAVAPSSETWAMGSEVLSVVSPSEAVTVRELPSSWNRKFSKIELVGLGTMTLETDISPLSSSELETENFIFGIIFIISIRISILIVRITNIIKIAQYG